MMHEGTWLAYDKFEIQKYNHRIYSKPAGELEVLQ